MWKPSLRATPDAIGVIYSYGRVKGSDPFTRPINFVTGGLAPNAGPFLRASDDIARLGDDIIRAGGRNIDDYAVKSTMRVGATPSGVAPSTTGPASVRVRTGNAGELRSAFTKIEPGNIGQGTATNASSRAFARRLGNATDDAGHAVGQNLGGLGGVRSGNIFPHAPSVNRGAFNQFEQQIARRVQAGDEVFVRVVPRYQQGATRSFEIRYQARINGKTVSRTFPNP